MSTREQEMPRTRVTFGPLGLETVEGWRKANEEDEAAEGCFTWWSGVSKRFKISWNITRCLEEVLLVDLVEPLPANIDPAGPDSIVRCRWFPKPVRELKVLQGVNTGLSQKLLLEFAETEILSE